MKYPHTPITRILSLIVALLTLASNSEAQTGDWQAVKNLPSGIRISVKVKRSYYCIVQYATEDELVCGVPRPFFRHAIRAYPRAEIREVRILPNPDQVRDAKIGAGIGAGAFAVFAAIRSKEMRASGMPPAIGIPLFAAIGAFPGSLVGMGVPVFQVVIQRGKVIYKR